MFEYAVLLVPIDLAVVALLTSYLSRARPNLARAYEDLGITDVAVSTLELRRRAVVWCEPSDTDGGSLTVADLVHPLVDNAEALSLTLERGGGLVVCGAHMTGKSTLLRAVATSAITTRAIRTAFATTWVGPEVSLFSAMRVADSLSEGRSLHQGEVDRLIAGLELLEGGLPLLVVLDEPFRGTNTVERLALTCVTVRRFAEAGSFVMLATHDGELQTLLHPPLRPVLLEATGTSASGRPQGLRLRFDEVRPSVGAAVALLEARGAPPDLVRQVTEWTRLLNPERSA